MNSASLAKSQAKKLRASLLCTCLLWFALVIFQITAIRWIDNTNLRTTNGLSKSSSIWAWENNVAHPVDTGGYLYFACYAKLSSWVPDSWAQYGVFRDFLTYRKVTIINAFFSATSTVLVFLLAFMVLQQIVPAFAIAFAHSAVAFVMLHGLNSEDIIPAYTFFLVGLLCIYRYLTTSSFIWLIPAAFAAAFVALLHWTVLPGMLIGFGVAMTHRWIKTDVKRLARDLVLAAFFFAVSVNIMLFAANHTFGKFYPRSFISVLYPDKAHPSEWTGFAWDKIGYLAIGIGNYFVGGENIASFAYAFDWKGALPWMVVSWLFFAITLGVFLSIMKKKEIPPAVKSLGLGILAITLIAQMENLYCQPRDPQFQIQPGFFSIFALILLALSQLQKNNFKKPLTLFCVSVFGIFGLAGAYNLHKFAEHQGEDSQHILNAEKFVQEFPPENNFVLNYGSEGWNTWIYVLYFRSEKRHLADYRFGVRPKDGRTPKQWADQVVDTVRAQLAQGKQIVASAYIFDRFKFIDTLRTIMTVEEAGEYFDLFNEKLTFSADRQTPYGPFGRVYLK